MPIHRIRPDPDQPRKRVDPQYIEELTETVRCHGILQPITLRYVEEDNIYLILSGECRYRAAKDAGLDTVPVWVKTPKNEHILLHQVIENWTRSDLNPFELADSLSQIRDANGYTQTKLASVTGKNKSEVSRLLSLLDLHPSVQKIARDDNTGRITKRHLFAIARLDTDKQSQIIRRVQQNDLTALDVERYVARCHSPQTDTMKKGAPVARRRFATSHANVVLTFRKSEVTDQDVLFALSEVTNQVQ